MLAKRFAATVLVLTGLSLSVCSPNLARAQEDAGQERVQAAPTQEELFRKFEESMSGVKLIGQFTVVGRDEREPSKEEYEIHSVKKLPVGDLWLITARIQYGGRDLTVPMPLPVKWAGNTPVITLDNTTIPGLGTFDCRVILDGDKYAGTWAHGPVGGHMFGTIEKLAKPATSP